MSSHLFAIALVAATAGAASADAAPPSEGATPDAAPAGDASGADAAPETATTDETTDGAGIHRVLLVSSTPELAHAARAALAPWTIEVLEETRPQPPADEAAAMELGRERGADRVAWLAGGELIVVDPATGSSARRPAPDGAGDPAAAASVALTLKTVLRLPPPRVATLEEPPPQIDEPVVVEPPGERIRFVPEVGGAMRLWVGGSVDVQPRVTLALGFVHPSFPRLRPSLVGSFGPSVQGGKDSFRGEYADVELGAQLAIELPIRRAWSIVPRARVTVHRVHVSGRLPMMETFDAHDMGVEAGADVAAWWRAGAFRAGAGVGAAALLGLPDYERQNSVVFESPAMAFQVFLTVLIAL